QHPRRRAFAAIALTEEADESREEPSSFSIPASKENSIKAERRTADEKGNEAEDEDDDEVFAAASRTRRRSRFTGSSSYTRNRQLRLLRTVHSAQARLQKSPRVPHRISSSFRTTPSIVLSVEEFEEPVRHPNYKNRIISPSPSLKVEVDEEDFYRGLGGGRRLSKLGSSQATIELPDDEDVSLQEEDESLISVDAQLQKGQFLLYDIYELCILLPAESARK
ncbi:Hypothetical protein FKW44_017470, partial [Caligus rogercresseyi]